METKLGTMVGEGTCGGNVMPVFFPCSVYLYSMYVIVVTVLRYKYYLSGSIHENVF